MFVRCDRVIFVLTVIMVVSLRSTVAGSQKEGSAFTQKALREIEQRQLIPANARIDRIQGSIEIGAYENIPVSQRINVGDILGDKFPQNTVNDLQSRVDQINS